MPQFDFRTGGSIAELRSFIDRGRPVPLGLLLDDAKKVAYQAP